MLALETGMQPADVIVVSVTVISRSDP